MRKFLKIYFLLAFLSSALLWIGVNNGGFFSYKVREKLHTKHTYAIEIQKILLANKDTNNTLHICLDIVKEPNHKQGIYELTLPLRKFRGDITHGNILYHYNDTKHQLTIDRERQGYTVIFPESELKEGCHVNSSIPILSNPHFIPPTGVNNYPLILKLDSNLTDVVYYPLDIKKGYFYHKNFFVYATNQPFVDIDWHDKGGSNYLIIELRGDRYYHDKVEFYKLPLSIVADFLTAPLQVLIGVGLWVLLIATGVRC